MTIEFSSTLFLLHSYTKQQGDYSELVEYDANTSITSLQRYGMKNDKSFGLIDDLSIEHNGNQITSVSDAVDENLDYEGVFDFINNNTEEENQYDGNGAILFDAGKQQHYTYDLLGHLKSVSIGACTIEYVYAPDGRKLRAIHSQMFFTASGTRTPNITTISDTTDYVGNLILKNRKPQMYQFAGGYYSFDGDSIKYIFLCP